MPNRGVTRYGSSERDHRLDRDVSSRRLQGSSSIAIHTTRSTHKLSPRTLNKYLPNLHHSLSTGTLGHTLRGRPTLDFTSMPRFTGSTQQKCLQRLFDYLEDLEVRNGSSTLLFDRLSATLTKAGPSHSSSSYYSIRSPSTSTSSPSYSSSSSSLYPTTRFSPTTHLFTTLGSYFQPHEFSHNSTIFAAMEAFFIHRSREICQFPAWEVMAFIATLDSMYGSMTSVLASLKASLGRGRRMQDLVDHCRGQLDTLSSRTLSGLEQMLGERLTRRIEIGRGEHRYGWRDEDDDQDGDERGLFMPRRYGGGRWSSFAGGGREQSGYEGERMMVRGKDGRAMLVDVDLVHVHALCFKGGYTYSAEGAPRGQVWATKRRSGGGSGTGDSRRGYEARMELPHHYHTGLERERERERETERVDRFGNERLGRRLQLPRFDDGYGRRRDRFARSPRRRSFSSDSDDVSIGGRGFANRGGAMRGMRGYSDYDSRSDY